MKLLYLFLFLFIFSIKAKELIVISNGKRTYSETINISEHNTRTILKNESTFTDNQGDYGIQTCLGTLDKSKDDVEFNLKCEGVNQNNEKYWLKVFRKTAENDAGVGEVKYLAGTGKYKIMINKKCQYAIRYFRKDIFFFRQACNI
tara:strand:- start:559 stop:996 length:438 start_codon:yes stop_codon:yes gene_type:complete